MKRFFLRRHNFLCLSLSLVCCLIISSCNDDKTDETNEEVYDLSWSGDLHANMAILDINETQYSLSDSIRLEISGGYYFYAENDTKKIYISWHPSDSRVELDTFKLSGVSYTDKDNVKNVLNAKGVVAIKQYEVIKRENAQDSILIEGVFHIKLDLQDGKTEDVKGAFNYDGLRNVMLGDL